MNILIVHDQRLPVFTYGGTERVIWALAKELKGLGHQVSFLLPSGSSCDFATVYTYQAQLPLQAQIPAHIDVVHFQKEPSEPIDTPYLVTIHGNGNEGKQFSNQYVFVSKNHAERHGSKQFVYNGLDWETYQVPDFNRKRTHFHFLGNAAWRVKNVRGAIKMIKQTREESLAVMGGVRFNFKMGMRFTFSNRVKFYGMVGGVQKFELLNQSKGLIFPVLWDEPFGLAITESLFYGCPVFGTPRGSLPELIQSDYGYLSEDPKELVRAIEAAEIFDPQKCHEYARDVFNARVMAEKYVGYYEGLG